MLILYPTLSEQSKKKFHLSKKSLSRIGLLIHFLFVDGSRLLNQCTGSLRMLNVLGLVYRCVSGKTKNLACVLGPLLDMCSCGLVF